MDAMPPLKTILDEMDQVIRLSRSYIAEGEQPAPYDPEVLKRWRASIARVGVLTALEIEAVLDVAGNALAPETFEDLGKVEQAKMVRAYERGMDKLRAMWAIKRRPS